MSVIKQSGIPTRKTKGAIGDIYIDTKTGNQYTCTFAYSVNGDCDCTWIPVKGVEEKVVEVKPVEPVVKEQEIDIVEEVKEEVVETKEVEEVKDTPKPRTNYAKPYQKSNRK